MNFLLHDKYYIQFAKPKRKQVNLRYADVRSLAVFHLFSREVIPKT